MEADNATREGIRRRVGARLAAAVLCVSLVFGGLFFVEGSGSPPAKPAAQESTLLEAEPISGSRGGHHDDKPTYGEWKWIKYLWNWILCHINRCTPSGH